MSQIWDHDGRVVVGVRIGKPSDIKDFTNVNPNDLMPVDHKSSNSLLAAIIANNYNGTVTIPSGEKYQIKLLKQRGSKILLTQTKLHTRYRNRRAQLVPISARYVEITLGPPTAPKASTAPVFTAADFPQLA